MLLNLSKKKWTDGLSLMDFDEHTTSNEDLMDNLKDLSEKYIKAVSDEQDTPHEERVVANVGKMDAKKHMSESVTKLMSSNILQCMGTMLDTVAF